VKRKFEFRISWRACRVVVYCDVLFPVEGSWLTDLVQSFGICNLGHTCREIGTEGSKVIYW
jgi:hypothetical protein